MSGKEIGNYRLLELIGEGGMGAVFAGEHRYLGTTVAIKILHGSYAGNPSVTQRFFQEAKSALEIGHPGIVKILDFGQAPDGSLYLVMELLKGQNLREAMAGGKFDEPSTARIGAGTADAIAAAHAKSIIHRDLKPDNIFLAGDQIKVLDFGIAKVMSSSGATRTGALLGSPQYMAPEQAKGTKQVGAWSDIYSLGAILFEMLTGRALYSGEHVSEILLKHLMEPPPRPSAFVSVSPAMDRLVLHCLEKDPQARPASMIEVRDRLRALISAKPQTPRVGSTRIIEAPSSFAPTTTLAEAASEIRESHAVAPAFPWRRVLLAGSLGAVALLVFGVWAAVRHWSSAPPVKSPPPVIVPAAPPPRPPPEERPPPVKTEMVLIRSRPPGAQVLINGQEKGVTPVALALELPQSIELALKGYLPARQQVSASGEIEIKLTAERPPRRVERPQTRPPPRPKPKHKEGLD